VSVTTVLTVLGMTCGHCEAAVRDELTGVAGVTDVQVELASGTVTVTSDRPIHADVVAAAIDEAGYTLGPAVD